MEENRETYNYLILLGGNIGNVVATMTEAIEMLGEAGTVIDKSAVYCSEAWGFEAEVFYNQVVELESELNPEELLDRTQMMEKRLGRKEKSKDGVYHSRLIDIDLLFCGEKLVETERLILPHKLLHKRRFTLVPLAEKWSTVLHPRMGKSVRELLEECSDEGKVWKNE